MTEYSHAQEVQDIAEDLIPQYHPHLIDKRVEYVFRDTAARTRGRTILGKAKRISGLNAFLADGYEPFLVIEVAADTWKELETPARYALVDHELSHCDWDEERGGQLLPHDLEEFRAIVERHGLWKPDLEHFAQAIQQRLDLGEAS